MCGELVGQLKAASADTLQPEQDEAA